MSKRTRRLLLLAFPAAMLAAVVGAWLLWPRTAITRENAAKIQKGMTLADVEAILGGPERDEGTGRLEIFVDQQVTVPVADGVPRQATLHGEDTSKAPCEWISNQLVVRIWLDANGCIACGYSAQVVRHPRPPANLLDRLRRWLCL